MTVQEIEIREVDKFASLYNAAIHAKKSLPVTFYLPCM